MRLEVAVLRSCPSRGACRAAQHHQRPRRGRPGATARQYLLLPRLTSRARARSAPWASRWRRRRAGMLKFGGAVTNVSPRRKAVLHNACPVGPLEEQRGEGGADRWSKSVAKGGSKACGAELAKRAKRPKRATCMYGVARARARAMYACHGERGQGPARDWPQHYATPMFAMRHGRSLAHYDSGDPLGQAARVHRESPKRLSEQRSRGRGIVSDENNSNKKYERYKFRNASDAKFEIEIRGATISMRDEIWNERWRLKRKRISMRST